MTLTFVATTYNLWGTARWLEPRPSLDRFFRLHRPDVLCVQELTPEACELIFAPLPTMSRVEDPLSGWAHEGNIFWNADLFEPMEHGTADIGILEEGRCLFWVRLRIRCTGSTMLVATAHFDLFGNTREVAERINVRVGQAERAVEALEGLASDDEPVLFMGDLNDDRHPLAVLRAAGFTDSFAALGLEPVPTNFAVLAAREILEVLPALATDLDSTALRGRMARAALLAGLAFSNTRTALAHSLSYPITLRYEVPHGLACSFTLPMLLRAVIGHDITCDEGLSRIFGSDLAAAPARLAHFLNDLGVSTSAEAHGVPRHVFRDLIADAFEGERGRNFIGRPHRVLAAEEQQWAAASQDDI